MKARRILPILLFLAAFTVPGLTQGQKAVFDGGAAFEYVRALSADGMIGRKAGEAGARIGTDYIVGRLKEWGLEPAGSKGYIQDMTFEYYEAERGASLALTAHDRTREFVHGEDWRQYTYSGSGPFAGDVVFLGYGISAPARGYDEYAGVNVKNKLVLFAVETPRRYQDQLGDELQLLNRVKAAQEHGARGVLTFRSDAQPAGAFFRGGLRKDVYRPDFVILSLEAKIVDYIFKWQKADPRYFFQQIELTGRPQSYDLGVQALLNVSVAFDEKRPAENVLAKIAGSDPALAGEYVIVGAHMDHLGVDMAGDILNGADDNASGTAVVLEAARVLKASGFRPRRTIVFALWAAEEEGLLGSKWYTEHPVYPLEKTVAVINLDMEGHGTGKVRVGGSYYAPEVWEVLRSALPAAVIDDVVPNRGGPGGSDHTHFLYNGVPAFMVSTDGPHFKTNRVGDVIGLIKPEILKKSGDFVVASLQVLSTDPRIPVLPQRKATFYWRYETMINHQPQPLAAAIVEHGNVKDPDVDLQLVTVAARAGAGDTLRLQVMKALMSAKEQMAKAPGLALYGAPATPGMAMMGPAGPSKTTVLLGLTGSAALEGEPRWADAFAKQGLSYVLLDQPGPLFTAAALTAEGRQIVEAIGDANLLLVARGLNAAQASALLEATRKPVVLQMAAAPEGNLAALVKRTESTIGLVLGKDEHPATYFARLDAARKAVGAESVAIVTEASLWTDQARKQMLGVLDEMLKAGYTLDQLADVTSGAFMRTLARARVAEPLRRRTT